ncbi:MAG: IS200/IS605 family transposase [Phormidesmis sp. CAN_BIN36]|nr:IS200/IS605 family transposase [Phormidesmis sp. CAN_BIN36]
MRKPSYEYRHYNHSVGLSVVHLVWIPKRRRKVLIGEVKTRLIQIFQELAIEKNWAIRTLEVAPDHIHLFVETHPTEAINQVVKAFKGRSATLLRREFPELQKLPSLWTNSYFFSTAGNVSADTIERYINDPHHE